MLEESLTFKLEDGEEITIRNKTKDDLEASYDFYQAMPEEEKELMRIDISDREAVARRFSEIEKGDAEQLVAEAGGKIVGEATLENMRYGWMRRVGELRILVAPEYRDKKVAALLARESFLLAARRGHNNLIARLLDGETQMYEILKNLHFKHEATQKGHAVDQHDRTHDVHLMTFSLSKMWHDLEEAVRATAAPLG